MRMRTERFGKFITHIIFIGADLSLYHCILQPYCFSLDELVDSTRRPTIKEVNHVISKTLIGQLHFLDP